MPSPADFLRSVPHFAALGANGKKQIEKDLLVFDGNSNSATASALEPSTVFIIPKETLLSMVADCPLALAIIRLFATRLRHLTLLVEGLSFYDGTR